MIEQNKEKKCYFCQHNIKDIDYKDTYTLRKFTNTYKKIYPSQKTGTCAKHQRKLALAIKKSRIMALLSFINN